MDHLKNTYQQQNKRALETDIAKETSGYFETGLLSILHGPLMHDVHTLHKALAGAGTNEALLNDVLLGRSNADMRAIKNAYQSTYKHSPEGAVAGDLSAKTERLFSMVLSATRAEESAPCIPQAIELDVNEIHKATEAKIGADQLVVCSILSSRSNGQIRAIAQTYEQRYGRSLEKVLESDFSGHMKIALVGKHPFFLTRLSLKVCLESKAEPCAALVGLTPAWYLRSRLLRALDLHAQKADSSCSSP